MVNSYLIPANSKKSQLILGFFTMTDLIIFISGAAVTLISFMIVNVPSLGSAILMLLPVLITGILVLPVPYYHNLLQLITNLLNYLGKRRRYYWRGWCVTDGNEIF